LKSPSDNPDPAEAGPGLSEAATPAEPAPENQNSLDQRSPEQGSIDPMDPASMEQEPVDPELVKRGPADRLRSAFQRGIRTHWALMAAGLASTLFWALLCLSPPPLFQLVDHKIYDVMHRRLPPIADPEGPVIVDIDEKSLAEIGQWPWPRYVVARLLTRIQDMEARAVGVDIVFAEPDRTSVHRVEADLSREVGAPVHIIGVPDNYRNNDTIFADTLRAGPFVLGYPFFYAPKDIPDTGGCDLHPLSLAVAASHATAAEDVHLPHAMDVTPNLAPFCDAAPAAGFINASPDEDGVLRKIGMITRFRGRFYPGLALATFILAADARQLVLETTRGLPESLRMTVNGEPLRIPLDREGYFQIRYYRRPGTFESIPASDLLLGRVSPDAMRGRTVFVGSSAPALSDAHPTPLHPLVPGIELHAAVAKNMLRRDFIARPWWAVWAESAGVALTGLLSIGLLLWRRALWGILAFGLMGILPAAGSLQLLTRGGLFLSPQFPAIVLISNFSILTLIKFLREELKNREQTEMLLQAQELTLHSLAALAETRDNETGNHLVRTQEYVRILAEYLGRNSPRFAELDEERIGFLYKSAPLHDIGKVGIPDRILLKPARLTDAEFEVMKQHTRYGRDALLRAEERLGSGLASPYFQYARDVVYAHHEKWGGGGYPLGLAGEDIPLAGRLMAIADVYDALRSKRVYKPAYSHAKARELIVAGRESQFDPEVVDAFLALEDRFLEIAEAFADPEPETEEETA
jgi:adenylate cyclase